MEAWSRRPIVGVRLCSTADPPHDHLSGLQQGWGTPGLEGRSPAGFGVNMKEHLNPAGLVSPRTSADSDPHPVSHLGSCDVAHDQ